MIKPVCVPCERFYRPEKNGFCILEGMPKLNGAQPGKENAGMWEPYKLWRGDKWRCPSCGHEIVVGWAHAPMSIHYEPRFTEIVNNVKPAFQVNDC